MPGAVSNQPPQTAAAPVNGAAPVLQAANAENSNILTIPGSKRESVTNYEVDKTIKVTRSSTGTIKRMTAAVVVNYLPGATAEGTVVPQALTEAQQAQMLALVRETIGYNAERGDSVNLMNAQFQQDTGRLASDLPLWQQPETIALAVGDVARGPGAGSADSGSGCCAPHPQGTQEEGTGTAGSAGGR